MITKEEIDQKAKEFKINPADVEKDYVFGWLLHAIYSGSSLGNELVLKGGNGLRKAYFPNTRFSKDLDFSVEKELDSNYLIGELNKVCLIVNEKAGVNFELDKTLIKTKDLPFLDNNVLEARLYFKGFYGEETISLRTQLDITQFDKMYLPIQDAKLIHPYSDNEACAATIKCQKVEEILASKLNTLLHRQKVADLFDLIYSIMLTSDFSVSRQEVVSTFLKKSIFESSPHSAKQQLLGIQLETYRPFWSTLVAPVASLFDFNEVGLNFVQLIESLFVLIPAPAPAFSSRMPRSFTSGSYSSGRSYSMPSYFSSDVRSTIINAGRARTMVEISYDGHDRLVEPYSMKYQIRKDGRGMEYFWGYDTSGGKSGRQSIKQFICDKIESAHPTNYGFSPRYAVEF